MRIQPNSKPGTTHSGFTLIELLVTVSIIAILAGIALPAYQKAQSSTRRIKGISNLKQAGAAIIAYAGEHENTLPGPCPLGIIPRYKTGDTSSLASFLAPYFGLPDAASLPASAGYKLVDPLVSPGMVAWSAATGKTTSDLPHYIQSDVLKGNNANGNTGTIRPFGGEASGGSPATPPIRLTRLGDFSIGTSAASRVRVWLISDVDQQSQDTQAQQSVGWFNRLPPKPVYGSQRLRIYADGHAEAASLDEL